MFHGTDAHDGQSRGPGPSTAARAWIAAPPAGYSVIGQSPVVGPDGAVYRLSSQGFICFPGPFSCGAMVEAFPPGGGTPLWSEAIPNESPFRTTPAVGSDGTVYVVNDQGGDIFAVSPGGHGLRWTVHGLALFGSPTIGPDGTLYVQDSGATMYALSGTDGTILWRAGGATGTSGIRGTPALSRDGAVVYFGTSAGMLVAVSRSGAVLWSQPVSGPTGAFIESAPAVDRHGTIYVATAGTYGNTPGDVDAFSPSGKLKWHTTTDGSFETTPAVGGDGRVVVANDVGTVYALSARDGSTAWTYQAPGTYGSNGFYNSSAAIARDGTVYLQNQFSTSALRKDGSLLWADPASAYGSSPALDPVRGTLYVSTNSGLVAY